LWPAHAEVAQIVGEFSVRMQSAGTRAECLRAAVNS